MGMPDSLQPVVVVDQDRSSPSAKINSSSTAAMHTPLPSWVIFDRSGHFFPLVDVRFTPKSRPEAGTESVGTAFENLARRETRLFNP
jgi:hypothetical protein